MVWKPLVEPSALLTVVAGDGEEVSVDVELRDALRDVDVEGVEVDVIATPGDLLAVGVDDQAGEVVDGAAGTVIAGNPLDGCESDRPGRDGYFDLGVKQLAGHIGEVGGDEDGRWGLRGSKCGKNCDEWQYQGAQVRWLEHGCLLSRVRGKSSIGGTLYAGLYTGYKFFKCRGSTDGKNFSAIAALLAGAISISALAADDDVSKAKPNPTPAPAVAPDSTTEGTVTAGGATIAYKAVAGTITVGATEEQDAQLGPDGKALPDTEMALAAAASKDPKDAPAIARMFYVAYFKKDANTEDRPITFLYNGGPGSSTVWLHMGSFGPKHVETADDKHLPAAPYRLVNNAYTLLDVSDLVFIDMPGTGFGRLVGKDKEKAFWGVDEDAHAYARFIARFISKYNRWNSPKYLFGESYGTTRSSVVSNILENEKSIDLNGVILLSQIFNFTSDIDAARGNPGIDLPFQLALPTYAATAYYHHKLPNQPAALEPFLKEVEDFAMGEYAHALAQGTDLSASEKQAVAEKLHNVYRTAGGVFAEGGLAGERRRI